MTSIPRFPHSDKRFWGAWSQGFVNLLSRGTSGFWAIMLVGALVAAYATWYTSSGRFPNYPDIQNDYVELGAAFLHGQLSLLERADSRLADLGNPYEYTQRKGIPYHWDASYYEGKYYLYWGPVPALVSAALQVLGGVPPPASLLVLLPYLGLLLVVSALFWHISEAFGRAARSTIWVFILVGLFNLPMLFTVGQPRHYQVSILFGQLFLLAGILGVVLHMQHRALLYLSAGGLAWGLAFGSRYNLAISIAIFTVFTAIWLWSDRKAGSLWLRLMALGAPLVACLIGLGIYNWARFGNMLETGLTYQLTIPEFRQISYSTAYVPSGLYAYLLYPITGSPAFPFIQAPHFNPRLLPESLYVPPGRDFDQIVFGILPTVPVSSLLVLFIPFLIVPLLKRNRASPEASTGLPPGALFWALGLGAAGQFAFLLVFFYVAERYIADFYLQVVLCLAMLIWWAHSALRSSRVAQTVLWCLVAGLTLWTVALGYFACFGVPVLVSLYYDPHMLAALASFWNGVRAALWLP